MRHDQDLVPRQQNSRSCEKIYFAPKLLDAFFTLARFATDYTVFHLQFFFAWEGQSYKLFKNLSVAC